MDDSKGSALILANARISGITTSYIAAGLSVLPVIKMHGRSMDGFRIEVVYRRHDLMRFG